MKNSGNYVFQNAIFIIATHEYEENIYKQYIQIYINFLYDETFQNWLFL